MNSTTLLPHTQLTSQMDTIDRGGTRRDEHHHDGARTAAEQQPRRDDDARGLLLAYLTTSHGASHAEGLLAAMATPNMESCVRVNTLRTTREEVMSELRERVQAWGFRIGLSPGAVPEPVPHPTISDAIMLPFAHSEQNSLKPRDLSSYRKSVVVDRPCGEAVLKGADIFVRGLLVRGGGIEVGDAVDVYCDVNFKAKATRASDIDIYMKTQSHMYIGWGVSHMSAKEMSTLPKGLAIEMRRCLYGSSPPTNSVLEGKIYAQNLPCVVVAHVLAPLEGETVLDMCASPGGKTSHISILMGNTGRVVAIDRSVAKCERISGVCKELGITNVQPVISDSRSLLLPKPERFLADHGAGTGAEVVKKLLASAPRGKDGWIPRVKGFPSACFDRILLDPVCAALGLRPRLALQPDTGKAPVWEHAALSQRRMLWCAANLLRPGGFLVYSTCSITAVENEEAVRYLLDSFPYMRLVPAEPRIGGPGLPGVGLSNEECAKVQRFDSVVNPKTMGFFIAKFQRMPESEDVATLSQSG
jgi:16S rRNA C967 or C1407 C5-methylase (RsmB/RsmF family)